MAAKDYGPSTSSCSECWPPYISPEGYRGAAYSYYLHGADGIALYNFWEDNRIGWEAVREMGDPVALSAQSRRYHCYLGELLSISKGERKTLGFYLPEDPKGPSAQARLRFSAVNLTLDHRFEVDLNEIQVEPKTFVFKRRGPGYRPGTEGAPHLPYLHIVEFPLAGTAATRGKNVLGVKLVEINLQIPSKNTIEIGRLEGIFEPTLGAKSLRDTKEGGIHVGFSP